MTLLSFSLLLKQMFLPHFQYIWIHHIWILIIFSVFHISPRWREKTTTTTDKQRAASNMRTANEHRMNNGQTTQSAVRTTDAHSSHDPSKRTIRSVRRTTTTSPPLLPLSRMWLCKFSGYDDRSTGQCPFVYINNYEILNLCLHISFFLPNGWKI